jgi:hypothetical protein
MAEIMAGTQRTRKPNIIRAASYHVIFWSLLGVAFLFTVWPDKARAQSLEVPLPGTQNPAVSPSVAQKFTVLPSLAVSEEFNDNVYLTRYNKIYDYITRAVPAFALDYKTSFWNWHLDAAYDYRYYARHTVTGDSTYLINFSNHSELIKNFFFLDVTDTYNRVSLTTSRDFTQQSLFVNQTDENIFTVNPYIMRKSESRFTPIVGYKYVNTWYKESTGISTVDSIAYAEMLTDLSSKMTFTTGVQYTQDRNSVQDYDKADVYAGPKYTYAQDSYFYALTGVSFLTFQFQSGTTTHMIWDWGITHRYSTITVSYEMKSGYIPDPTRIIRRLDSYVATLSKTTPRDTLEVSAGLYEYRNAATNHLENTNYTLEGTLKHALSPILTIFLDETIERLDDNVANTTIAYWHSDIRLERRTLADLLLTLEYMYTNSYSHDSYLDNYVNNRLIVGLTKHF